MIRIFSKIKSLFQGKLKPDDGLLQDFYNENRILAKDLRKVLQAYVKLTCTTRVSMKSIKYPLNYLLGVGMGLSALFDELKSMESFSDQDDSDLFQRNRDIKLQINIFENKIVDRTFEGLVKGRCILTTPSTSIYINKVLDSISATDIHNWAYNINQAIYDATDSLQNKALANPNTDWSLFIISMLDQILKLEYY